MNYFVALSLIIQINLARITNNDPECEVFKSKIGAAKVDGNNSTQLEVGGVVSFQPGTANLEIQLHYNDDEYFSDPKYKGLTKEDGIDNELTCLDLILLKFPDNTFNEATQEEITDLTPVASSDKSLKRRYLTYIIPGNQLNTRLIQSESRINFVYTGFYAIAYYIQTKVYFTYQFQFSVTVKKATNDMADGLFLPFNNFEILGCKTEGSCTVNPQCSVDFCTDSTCLETTESPNIYINDYFWIIQKITTEGLSQSYLQDTTIRYVGEGLNKDATIEAAYYKTFGQAIYKLKASFAWTKLRIQVNSEIKTTAPSSRLLADTDKTQTSYGQSVETCILVRNSPECPTCNEMIENNPDQDAPKVCEKVDSSAKKFFLIGLPLLSFFI